LLAKLDLAGLGDKLVRFTGPGNGSRDINITLDNAGQASMSVNAPAPGYTCNGVRACIRPRIVPRKTVLVR
jgi:hypothetical protein